MIQVRPAVGQEIETALRILMRHVSPNLQQQQVSEALVAAQRGELRLDDLLVAYRGQRAVGALLAVIQPGATASIWPPEVTDGDKEVEDALVRAAIDHLAAADVVIIQSIVERDEQPGRRILERNGVPHLTDLKFMERKLGGLEPPVGQRELDYICYSPETHARFVAMLELSYQDTLDCPELDGVRTAEQALASHQAAGGVCPEFWRLYRSNGEDAGILLLSEHADQRAWELVYMGVASAHRGVGLGQRMLSDALASLPQNDSWTVFLAVDSRNQYACATYERIGFSTLATRALHLRLRR